MAAGFLLAASSGFGPSTFAGVASETARAYGVGLAIVGIFIAVLMVTHVAVQIPGGVLTDRMGPRTAGIIGLLFVAVGSLLALIAPEPAVVIVARLVSGIGTGISFIAGIGLVRESTDDAFAQGLYGGVSLAFAGLAVVSVPQIYGPLGWRAPFWATLVVAVVGLVAVAASGSRAAAPGRSERLHVEARAAAGAHAGGAVDRGLRRTATLYSFSYGVSFVVAAWTTELLERTAGFSAKLAAAVAAMVLALGIVSRPLGGFILRRHPGQMRAAVAGSLILGAFGTGALMVGDPAWLAALGGLAVGLAAGIPFAAAFTGAALTRPDAPARAAGLVNAAGNSMVLVGTPLVGLTFALPGEGRLGFGALLGLWLVAVAFLPGPRGLGVAEHG